MASTTMFDMLTGMLAGPLASVIARRLGTSEATVQKAITLAIPVLVSALARNASTTKGAASLSSALAAKHDGSLLNDVDGFIQSGDTTDGTAILRHVLGSNQAAAEAGIGKASGLDAEQVSQLLATLAPLVLAYLGRQQSAQQLDTGGLGDLLKKENASAKEGAGGDLGGLADILLGGAEKGDVKSQATRFGLGMLRKWLSGQ
jgi:hypothetical protein